MTPDRQVITGIILAGGEARRMGGTDKGLVRVRARPMIEYVITGLGPQVATLIINANRNREVYESYGFPVVPDELDGFNGPLAGMASGMRAARTEYVVTVPCDSPFLPPDLVARFGQKVSDEGADICMAHNGERTQPVFSFMRTRLLDSLLAFLARGERKIDRWFGEHACVVADFSDRPEAFLNINTPEELADIEKQMDNIA